MDADPALPLAPGNALTLRLCDGTVVGGRLEQRHGGWLELSTADGPLFANLAQVACIALSGPAGVREASAGLPRPESKDRPVRLGAKAPGRPWQPDELKRLSDAFLDGASDGDLAERFNRTRSQITELHRGFECARGNLVEDQISPAARLWVERWRRVLGS